MNKIGFIGGGKMATSIINGIINSNLFNSENIIVSDPKIETLQGLENQFHIKITGSNTELAENTKLIVMAVKPFVLRDVLNQIKHSITKEHVIISIAAGISTETIEEILPEVSVIRVMPNTPALVNEGMSAVCKGKYASDEDSDIAVKIFSSVGKVIKTEEKFINTITALSGSGPAFYYYIINEIARAGFLLGLDGRTSLELAAQTALGSAKMILESQLTPQELIKNVTTPGGCTEEGNKVLINSDISDILYKTIEATEKKTIELGKN